MVRYLKRLKSSKFVRVKAFPMYGGMGVSAPSLHRESTDSLIEGKCSSFVVIHCSMSVFQNIPHSSPVSVQSTAQGVGWRAIVEVHSAQWQGEGGLCQTDRHICGTDTSTRRLDKVCAHF